MYHEDFGAVYASDLTTIRRKREAREERVMFIRMAIIVGIIAVWVGLSL